jgi:predicted amidohydrolase
MENIIKLKVSRKLCDLYIFPELCIEGYGCNIVNVAEYADGNSFRFLSNIAKKYQIGIVYGFAEKDDQDSYYCSLMFIGKDGSKICCYRKTHIYSIKSKFGFFEAIFTPGDSIGPIVNYLDINFGFLICYDGEVPECARILTLMGAQVLITIAAYPNDQLFKKIMSTRSKENIIYSVVVSGTSFVCIPTGKVVEENKPFILSREDIKYFDKKRNEKLSMRRPDLYNILTEK